MNMRLMRRTEIRRQAMTVWGYVIRPERFQKWNKQIAGMAAYGEFRLGQPFATRYKWRGRQVQCVSVATSIVVGSLLELRHSSFVGDNVNPEMEVTERKPGQDGCHERAFHQAWNTPDMGADLLAHRPIWMAGRARRLKVDL